TASASQSSDPRRPPVSVTVTAVPPTTLVALTASCGPTSIVNVNDADVPPPGDAVKTLTCAVPFVATSAAPIDADSCVAPTNVVGRLAPFHWTMDDEVKPLPITASVNGPLPENARLGDSEVRIGTGFSDPST